MATKLKNATATIIALLVLAYMVLRFIVAPYADNNMNKRVDLGAYQVSEKAKALHGKLTIMDWHADTMLWNRDLLEKADRGHVDLPRMQEGNIALQMFTTVTKTPRGQNLNANDASSDNITLLSIAQGWPGRTWDSLLERALFQAEKLDGYIQASQGQLMWVRTQAELKALMQARHASPTPAPIGVLLGTEGAHPLEGNAVNIDKLYNAGFRMVGLIHFFDNRLGGSLHGTTKGGLTEFGKAVVGELENREIIIDLAHASEQVAWDTLAITTRPVVVSHTGFRGHCDTPRNFSDELMQEIARKGGLVAVGFWDSAACGDMPTDIAASIAYGINLLGEDHIALGSDWDSTVKALDASDIATITEALQRRGLSGETIAKVMGGNSVHFLSQWLPKS